MSDNTNVESTSTERLEWGSSHVNGFLADGAA
jgi:hypothetical protein